MKHYRLCIEVSEHFTFISLVTCYLNKTALLQNSVKTTQNSLFFKIGCCSIHEFYCQPKMTMTQKSEEFDDIKFFLKQHGARILVPTLPLMAALMLKPVKYYFACSTIANQDAGRRTLFTDVIK